MFLYYFFFSFQLDGLSGVPAANGSKSKLFSFNVVFEPGASQEDVFQFSGIRRLIEMAVEGFSTTAFCYGQTGSGKTHTLTGPPGLVITTNKMHRNTKVNTELYFKYHAFLLKCKSSK